MSLVSYGFSVIDKDKKPARLFSGEIYHNEEAVEEMRECLNVYNAARPRPDGAPFQIVELFYKDGEEAAN